MDSRIFRKVSLERLASPDQLDQIIRISRAKSWAALLAIVILASVGVVWACEGAVPTTVTGHGMILRSGGLITVVSRGAGLVLALNVEPGAHVKANQVIAKIAQPGLAEKLREMTNAVDDTRRRQQQALTLRSEQSRLSIEAVERQRVNTTREIGELSQQAKLAEDQIPVTDQLFEKGLVTKQQTIAARQKLISINSDIEDRKAKLKQFDQEEDAARAGVRQAQLDMEQQISGLERDIAVAEKELSLVERVVCPYQGEVVEVKVSAGATVAEGAPILTVQPDGNTILQAVGYIAAAQVKDCRPGMQVQISPSTVKREEFGYILGTITFVADYPATPAAIMRHFQNESLVTSIVNSGPVTEVGITLDPDAATYSGLHWSSSKGPDVKISSGTICDMDVVTRRQAPIDLVIPLLKEKLGIS